MKKEELLSRPHYLLTKYQNEIYRQLSSYMTENNLTQSDVAKRLGVSNAYVSQIINGNFNFTLKKLIELGILIGKVPEINFIAKDEFIHKSKGKKTKKNVWTLTISYDLNLSPTFNAEEAARTESKQQNFDISIPADDTGVDVSEIVEVYGVCLN